MGEKLVKDIEINIDTITSIFSDNDDLICRRIEIGELFPVKMALIYIDGLASKEFLSEFIVQSLFWAEEIRSLSLEGFKTSLYDSIIKKGISTTDIGEEDRIDEIVTSILSGEALFLIEDIDKGIMVEARAFPGRGVDEPETETVIRGPRDGFTESVKENTILIRRRIKDSSLKVKFHSVGKRSKTSIALMYIEGIVNDQLLKEVKTRLEAIDIDAVLDSSILENLLEDNYLSPFPQIENTERPDSVAASLYEGRVALVVDNSPFALVVPATLGTLMQSSEDYYTRWPEATVIRLLRIIAAFFTAMAPALYVAITSYHPGLIPTKLSYYVAANRINVPFPSVVEAGLMEITIEILRESGTRISGPIGTTIGIVGGLIIGQASVDAGIVSPLMLIVVAITTISSFALPSYEMGSGLRICRFFLIILSAVLGLYGIMLGVIIIGTHLLKMYSFNVPYTSPYSGLGVKEGDLKDTLVKAPVQELRYRPTFTQPKNKRRMKRRDNHEENP